MNPGLSTTQAKKKNKTISEAPWVTFFKPTPGWNVTLSSVFPALWNFKSFPHTCKEARGRLWPTLPAAHPPSRLSVPTVWACHAWLVHSTMPGSLQNYRHHREDESSTRPGSEFLRVPWGLRRGALGCLLHVHARPHGPWWGVWISLPWIRISSLLLFTESLPKIPPQFTPPVQPPATSPVCHGIRLWTGVGSVLNYSFNLLSLNTGSFSTGRSCFSSRLKSFAHFYLVICLFLTDLEVSYTFWTLILCQLNALKTSPPSWWLLCPLIYATVDEF